MVLTIDRRSLLWLAFGVFLGMYITASVWYGVRLTEETARHKESRDALLDLARCDDAGFVNVQLPGGGEYTCTPKQNIVTAPPKKPVAKQQGGPEW